MDAAAPPAAELHWIRAPGGETCIERREVSARVEATVGRRVFAAVGEGDAVVRGQVGPDRLDHGWLAVVELRRAGVVALRRELKVDGSDCRGFDEAIVLIVALMVDAASDGARPLVIAGPSPPVSVSVGADVALTSGMLPGVDVGIGLASEATLPPLWPIGLWAHEWPVSEALAGQSGGRLGAWTVGAGLCPRPWATRLWEAFACAGGSGGAVYSVGVGLDVLRSHVRPYFEADLRAGLRVRIAGPLFARLEAGGAVPMTRDSYAYTQADGTTHQVFRTAAVLPVVHFALEIRPP